MSQKRVVQPKSSRALAPAKWRLRPRGGDRRCNGPRVGKEYGNSRYNLLPGWGEKNPVRQESERIRTRLCLYALIAGVKLMKIADSAQSVANPLALRSEERLNSSHRC